MIELISPKKVTVKTSLGRGLGCFAIEKIFKDEVFEECHLIEVIGKDFFDYFFTFPRSNAFSFKQVLPLGFGCIYNHNDQPNANWKDHPEGIEVFQFYALRDIKIGEEIFTFYGDSGYWNSRPHVKVC